MAAAPSLNRILSVMIPAYNEERTLEVILKHVLERPEVGEVVAVDDGSTDGTWAILTRCAEHDPRVRHGLQVGRPSARLWRHRLSPCSADPASQSGEDAEEESPHETPLTRQEINSP